MKKRILSIITSLALCLSALPFGAIALAADLCEHHTEHIDCGYIEGEAPCGYSCAECAAADGEQPIEPEQPAEPVCTCGVAEGEAHGEGCALYEAPVEPEQPAEPECACGTDDPAIHATTCPAYVAPENPICTCAEKCPEDAPNEWCDVCGVQGAAACAGEDSAAIYENSSNYDISTASVIIDDSCGDSCAGHIITSANSILLVKNTITVQGGTHDITLSGVSIESDTAAFSIEGGTTVHLTLADGTNNILSSTNYCAGLELKGDAALTITCEGASQTGHTCDTDCGSLNATGGGYGAGIGGSYGDGSTGGTGGSAKVTITGGNITATGNSYGAGIGGGYGYSGANGGSATVTISGGNVTATGSNGGAGIGGGYSGIGNGGSATVEIFGSAKVTANGGGYGAGIGGGYGYTSGNGAISLGDSAHVKCENGTRGSITLGDGIYRTASDGDFQSTAAGETTPQGYFEYLSADHYTISAIADPEKHAIICADETCGLKLTNAAAPHSWNANADGGQVCTICGYTRYDVWVGGVQVGGVPDADGKITVTGSTITGTVTLAPASAAVDDPGTSLLENAPTLTLSGASITAAEASVAEDNKPVCGVYSRPALNLVLTGANTITASDTADTAGVMADGRDLAISGGGSLKINSCGHGISALKLMIEGVTVEIINSVYAVSLTIDCTIKKSTVSAVGSNTGISTANGLIKIDDSSVYAEGEQYSFSGTLDAVSVELVSGAHVKAEGTVRVNLGVNYGTGYLRTASGNSFEYKEGGNLETGGSYFEYVGEGHYTASTTASVEAHTINCSCTGDLELINASAPHRWIANANGAACAACKVAAAASVTISGTTAYYYDFENALDAADGKSGAVLKLFADVETVAVGEGGFTLDPNGKSITKLEFASGSSSIGIASQPGNTPAVTMEAPGVFATPSGVTFDPAWFTSTTTGYVVVKDGDDLKLAKGITGDMVEVVQSATYNGLQQNAKVTVTWTDSSKLEEGQHYAVGYKDSKGDWVFPTDAGIYTVVITGMGSYAGEVVKTYTINKAAVPTITYPAAGGLTYGQTLADSALSGGSTEYGSFAWKDETTVPTVGDATGYPMTFTVNENTAKNYETITTTEQNVQVNVTQAAPVISLSASVSGASGNRQVVLTATMSAAGSGALPTGTVQFVNATDGGSETISTANISNGVATYPWMVTEDKVYTIQAVYNGDTNYQAVDTSKEVDTNKQPQAVLTITSGTTIAYGQTLTLTTTGGSTNGTVTYNVTPSNVASVSGNVLTPTKVGSVTVTATMAGNDTYLDVTSAPVTITITQATGIGSVTMAGWTYGETASNPVPTSTTNGTGSVTYLYKVKGADDSTYTATKPTDAGTYTVKATFAATDNYTEATATADFTIIGAAQAAPSAPEQESKTYNSVTLKTIAANSNGAEAEYSKDGGATWQSSPSFTGLSASTKYNFAARYGAVGNYAASPASAVTEITTNSAPSSGGGGGGGYTPPAKNEPETGSSGGWNEIQHELADLVDAIDSGETEPGETVTVEMNGATEVPAEVLAEIAGKDVNVEFDMGGGIVWEVNGQDIPADMGDLNLGIETGGNSIPVNVINTITGETAAMQLELSHNGPFGTTLHLSLNLGGENRGHWANLYYYDGKNLHFRHASRVDDKGRASWPFDHASSYAVIIDDENHDPEWVNPFTDVKETDWFYEAVAYVNKNGLMAGTSTTERLFSPDGITTRAQIVTILHRLEGTPATTSANPFTDVADGQWYADAVIWAAENGITSGTGDGSTFSPNDPITREQLAAFLYRYAQHKGGGFTGLWAFRLEFEDVAALSDWAYEPMCWCVMNGIIGGIEKDGSMYLDPQASATRAQAAVMLQRFCEKVNP